MNRIRFFFLVVAFVFTVIPLSVRAQEDTIDVSATSDLEQTLDAVLAGHSIHAGSFNEGPRQSAYLTTKDHGKVPI